MIFMTLPSKNLQCNLDTRLFSLFNKDVISLTSSSSSSSDDKSEIFELCVCISFFFSLSNNDGKNEGDLFW